MHEQWLQQTRCIFRFPSGRKAFNWQFEIIARVPIHSVELASHDEGAERCLMPFNTNTPTRNHNMVGISQPIADVQSLVTVVNQLKQSVESLGGLRGTSLERAVTLEDLVNLGLVTTATLQEKLK